MNKKREILITIGLIIILLIFGFYFLGNKPQNINTPPLPTTIQTPEPTPQGCHYANGEPAPCAKVEKEI